MIGRARVSGIGCCLAGHGVPSLGDNPFLDYIGIERRPTIADIMMIINQGEGSLGTLSLGVQKPVSERSIERN